MRNVIGIECHVKGHFFTETYKQINGFTPFHVLGNDWLLKSTVNTQQSHLSKLVLQVK